MTRHTKLLVQRRQCATCIFNPEYWAPGRLTELLDEIRDPAMEGHFHGYRICHHSRREVVCAGFWAKHRDNFDLGQIAQRLGLVHYYVGKERK
jgi:hypothetical protein